MTYRAKIWNATTREERTLKLGQRFGVKAATAAARIKCERLGAFWVVTDVWG